MRRYWEIDQTFAQPSESLLKKNLKESVKKQKEKGNKLEPVVISGRAIAKSWWGKAWCDNLEHYADFASRLERGKRYVRTGTVIDLKIQKGKSLQECREPEKLPTVWKSVSARSQRKSVKRFLNGAVRLRPWNDYCPVISQMI